MSTRMRYSERNNKSSRSPTPQTEQAGKSYQFKVCLAGTSGVGKTSIFNRLKGIEFSSPAKSHGDTFDFRTTVRKEDELIDVTLKVWDTAGREQHNSLTQGYFRLAHLIILVFDVGEKVTMYDMSEIVCDIIKGDNCPAARFYYVVNKTDLDKWDVEKDEVETFLTNTKVLSKDAKNVAYTSAKTGSGVSELFETAAKMLIGLDVAPVDPGQTIQMFRTRALSNQRTRGSCCN